MSKKIVKLEYEHGVPMLTWKYYEDMCYDRFLVHEVLEKWAKEKPNEIAFTSAAVRPVIIPLPSGVLTPEVANVMLLTLDGTLIDAIIYPYKTRARRFCQLALCWLIQIV